MRTAFKFAAFAALAFFLTSVLYRHPSIFAGARGEEATMSKNRGDATDGDTAPQGPPVQKVMKTDAEWKKLLTPEQFRILRHSDTERPFSCGMLDNKEPGTWVCAACGLELFRQEDKFNSGTGWLSFKRPYFSNHVIEKTDFTLGIPRTEVLCARCDGHLGHVFEDGPRPTGLRYCMNGDAMKFVPRPAEAPPGKP